MILRGQGQAKEKKGSRTPSREVCRERKRESGACLMYLVVLKSAFPSLPSPEVFCSRRINQQGPDREQEISIFLPDGTQESSLSHGSSARRAPGQRGPWWYLPSSSPGTWQIFLVMERVIHATGRWRWDAPVLTLISSSPLLCYPAAGGCFPCQPPG